MINYLGNEVKLDNTKIEVDISGTPIFFGKESLLKLNIINIILLLLLIF